MHLLFTDPSTSPRTELGRIMFGVLYASSVVALYVLLDRLGLPTFYDKLLSVPLLNLSIQAIDRAARSNLLKRFDPGALGRSLTPKRRNLAYMTLWVALFVTMQAQTGAEATLARADSLKDQGRMEEALTRYREFVQGDPDDFEGQRRLGGGAARGGPRRRRSPLAPPRRRTAAAQRRRALQPWLRPVAAGRVRPGAGPFQAGAAPSIANYATAQYGLGLALWAGGQHDEAIRTFRDGVSRWPASAEAHYNLGAVLERSGDLDAAVASYTRSTEIDPSYADANFALGLIHAKRGEQAQAIDRFGRVLRSKPDSTPARTQLAWLLATSPDATREDHRAALALAEPLVGGASDPDAGALDVLAAALAANGQFDRAAATAERMLAALGRDGADPRTLAAARERLALYRSGKAYVSAARP